MMSFSEDVYQLSAQIAERMSHAAVNKELTKQALVIPFVQVLGFDAFNPLELKPDYDFGQGETVDYTLFKEDVPVMLMEVMAAGEDLPNYDPKLAFLFNSTPSVRYAILTDGVSYKFFADMDKKGVMDRLPFLTVYITGINDLDIELMTQFHKDQLETHAPKEDGPAETGRSKTTRKFSARELAYVAAVEEKLKELFHNPPDELVGYLIKTLGEGEVTEESVAYFNPIVRKAFMEMIQEMISAKVNEKVEAILRERELEAERLQDEAQAAVPAAKKVVKEPPLDPEYESFSIIEKILSQNGKDVTDLKSRDSMLYYGLWSVDGWFVKLNLNSAKKHIITRLPVSVAQSLAEDFTVGPSTRGNGKSRVYIDSHKDLIKLEKLIVRCYEEIAEA